MGSGSPTARPSPAEPFVLDVVASVTGPSAATDATYLDGIRLAERDVNRPGGVLGRPLRIDVHDDRGDPAETDRLLAEVHAVGGSVATLLVGHPWGVEARRRDVQAAGDPLVLLAGDLYTPRTLYRQTFMTGVPLRWQAAVLARYLVRDRRHRRILAVVESGPGERSAREAVEAAFAEEGAAAEVGVVAPGAPVGGILDRGADAALFLGSAAESARIAAGLAGAADPPQLALSAEGLSPEVAPPPGTVAPYPYTWAGWAEPVPRVGRFRARFREAYGGEPSGFAQEGYDAVRALAEALERTRGRPGEALVRALERFRRETYSALPVRLGPDDRTLIDESQLGLFAVAGPGEPVEPWLTQPPLWRPLMRTFTYDGERTVVLDRDRGVFFPGWRGPRPSPKYPRSRYGIVTRPDDDPLH